MDETNQQPNMILAGKNVFVLQLFPDLSVLNVLNHILLLLHLLLDEFIELAGSKHVDDGGINSKVLYGFHLFFPARLVSYPSNEPHTFWKCFCEHFLGKSLNLYRVLHLGQTMNTSLDTISSTIESRRAPWRVFGQILATGCENIPIKHWKYLKQQHWYPQEVYLYLTERTQMLGLSMLHCLKCWNDV